MGADNANLARATISLEAEKIAKWAHARFLEPNTILNHISIDTREGPLHAEEDILTETTIFHSIFFLNILNIHLIVRIHCLFQYLPEMINLIGGWIKSKYQMDQCLQEKQISFLHDNTL